MLIAFGPMLALQENLANDTAISSQIDDAIDADAGYRDAVTCAGEQELHLPGILD